MVRVEKDFHWYLTLIGSLFEAAHLEYKDQVLIQSDSKT